MKLVAVLVAVVAGASALPAWSAEPFLFSEHDLPGGWSVVGQGGSESTGICLMEAEWEAEAQGLGTTKLRLSLSADADQAFLTVANTKWSAKEGSEYKDISFYLDRRSYSGGTATGSVLDGVYNGFSIWVPPEFLPDFGKARGLTIRKGEVVVDGLSLVGSEAALASLRNCVKGVERADAARRRAVARFAHIAKDPFAAPPVMAGASSPPPTGPASSPMITRPNWLRKPDGEDLARAYPAAARQGGVSGRSSMRCVVTARGTLTSCRVISETPAGAGFGPAALRVASRYQMSPRQENGQSVDGGEVTVPIVWQPGE